MAPPRETSVEELLRHATWVQSLARSLTGDRQFQFSHLPPVQSVAISHDNRYVAAGNLMGGVRV